MVVKSRGRERSPELPVQGAWGGGAACGYMTRVWLYPYESAKLRYWSSAAATCKLPNAPVLRTRARLHEPARAACAYCARTY